MWLGLKTIHSSSVWKPPASVVRAETASLRHIVDGVAGLGAPKSGLIFILWDLFKAGHFQSGLGDAMEMFHLFELASGRYESWPAFSLWIFSQTVLFGYHPNSNSLESWFPEFYINPVDRRSAQRCLDMLEWTPFPMVRAWHCGFNIVLCVLTRQTKELNWLMQISTMLVTQT